MTYNGIKYIIDPQENLRVKNFFKKLKFFLSFGRYVDERGEKMTNHEADKLIKETALGDKSALENLYKSMSKPVYFYVLRLVGDPDVAEDVMQDTFVSVMRSCASYDEREKGKSWIFTIAKNRAMDYLRRANKTVSLEEGEIYADGMTFTDETDSRLYALRLLEGLNKKERDIVTLRLFGDMTLTQVSKELGLPKGTVFWTYNNAIKKLRNSMGGEKDEK